MDKLTRWTNVTKDELCKVEDPFFSVSIVRSILMSRGYVSEIKGIDDLLRACGVYGSVRLTSNAIDRVLRPVASGEWMLIKNEPFKPIDIEKCWCARVRSQCVDDTYLLNTASAISGPGKWRTVAVQINKFSSGAAFFANFLTSRGDEGRVFLSSGKDFANTTRTVSQKWVPLDTEDRGFAKASVIHRYGLEREVTQIYVEADDAWDVSGSSWHWRPVVANDEYEFKDE